MALPIRSLALFAAVVAAAGLFTVSGLSLTAGMVTEAAANAPSAARPTKPSYIVRLPVAKAEALDVAKSVTVKPPAIVTPSIVTVAPPATTATAELTVAPKTTYSHQVVATGANVRSGPKKSFPQVFTLAHGSWVNVGENVRGWVKVTDETGREGWVYGSLLQASERPTSSVTFVQ